MSTAQIILSLLTIVCSGVVSAIVTYKLNSGHEEKQFLRKKLEEVSLSFTVYSRILGTHFITYQSVMVGKISYNDALDMTIESKQKSPFETLSMLVNIYFPNLDRHLENLIKYRELGNDIIHDFKSQYKNGVQSSKSHTNAITETVHLLSSAESEFKAAVKAESALLNKKAF